MVNKAVVGVIGVVLIATLGVGALVGLQGGGAAPADGGNGNGGGNGAGQGTATATPTPNGTAGNASTPADAETPANDRLELTRSEFTAAEIEENVTDRINALRTQRGLDPLEVGPGTTKAALRRMAREHSRAMAAAETVTHEVDNVTTQERYRSNDLYYTCQFKPPGEGYTARPGAPDIQQFEWIAGTETASSFTQEHGLVFHQNESTVADELVDQWRGSESIEYGLLSGNYGKAGVGVNVTRDGTVYATVELCGK